MSTTEPTDDLHLDWTEREALSSFLFSVFRMGTQPNAHREADAILDYLEKRRAALAVAPAPSDDDQEALTNEALWDWANDIIDWLNIEDLNPPSLIEGIADRFRDRFGLPQCPPAVPSDDNREALDTLLSSGQHAPMEDHDPRDGSCRSCPWPLHMLPPDEIRDALLADGWRRSPVSPPEDVTALLAEADAAVRFLDDFDAARMAGQPYPNPADYGIARERLIQSTISDLAAVLRAPVPSSSPERLKWMITDLLSHATTGADGTSSAHGASLGWSEMKADNIVAALRAPVPVETVTTEDAKILIAQTDVAWARTRGLMLDVIYGREVLEGNDDRNALVERLNGLVESIQRIGAAFRPTREEEQ